MALDTTSLVILTYETGSALIECCETVKQCHAESGRIAVRTARMLGALESAAGEFYGNVVFEASLIKLKCVLEQATDLVERCKKPASARDRVTLNGRENAIQAALRTVEEELERVITDLTVPMLTDIRRATEKISKAVEDIKAREEAAGATFDEEALARAVQDGIHRELNARSVSGLPVRDVIQSNVIKAQEPDEAVPSTAGHPQALGKSGKSGSIVGRLGRVRFDMLVEGEILGEGAFGIVLSGTYKGEEVAIKKARGSVGDPKVLNDFRREAEIHFSIHHPNIVRVLAFSLNDAEHPPCLVMERMEESLYSYLNTHRKPTSLVDRLGILHDVCQGLQFLHEHGIVHRDVKSPNVLMDEARTAKLSDFGLAAVTLSIAGSTGSHFCGKVGSEFWMAPEVHQGGDATSASDVFSFGVVMWEVICHRTVGAEVPVGVELLGSTAAKPNLITRTPNPLQQQMQDLLDRCGRKNSEERPYINKVAEDLKAILNAAVAITDAATTTNDDSCAATEDFTNSSTSVPSEPPRVASTPPGASPSPSVSPKKKDGRGIDTTTGPANVASTVMSQEETMTGDVGEAVTVITEGELMKKDDSGEWKLGYFRLLKEGYFVHYSSDADKNSKTIVQALLALTPDSVTTYTNTENCFTVKTGEGVWFLMAEDDDSMDRWMSFINTVIIDLFRIMYKVPEDNYWSQGLKGRFFYRMNDTAPPQWIRAFPEKTSPRTGDGVFPGDVIEVSQVLSNNGNVFVRIADDRGWVGAKNPGGDAIFTEVKGTLAKDTQTYRIPPSSEDPTPILFGPSLDSQLTGEAFIQGELAKAAERFTPVNGSSIAFIKLADGRGWVPVKRGGNSGVTPIIT